MKSLSKGEVQNHKDRIRVFAIRCLRLFLFPAVVLSLAGWTAIEDSARPVHPPKNSKLIDPAAVKAGGYPAGAAAFFLPNVQVNADPGNLEDDFAPAIAVDSAGRIYVVWNIEEPGDEGIYFSRSDDGGATFQRPSG
jgi:hypothetical protein